MNRLKCLTPWDFMSKRLYATDGVYATLNAGNGGGGQTHGVCYSIEGHIVDRETGQNGRGWAEGYAHTLNATDRHAVCFRRSEHEEENGRHG